MVSETTICAVFNVLATIFAWSAFGMGIAATTSDDWINFGNGTINTRNGLWITTTFFVNSGLQAVAPITNPEAWLNVARAFVILMVIFTFAGGMVNTLSQWDISKKSRKNSGYILLIAGFFGITAGSVYSGVAPQDLNANGIANIYGTGYILSWVTTGVLFLANIFNQISAFYMPDLDV